MTHVPTSRTWKQLTVLLAAVVLIVSTGCSNTTSCDKESQTAKADSCPAKSSCEPASCEKTACPQKKDVAGDSAKAEEKDTSDISYQDARAKGEALVTKMLEKYRNADTFYAEPLFTIANEAERLRSITEMDLIFAVKRQNEGPDMLVMVHPLSWTYCDGKMLTEYDPNKNEYRQAPAPKAIEPRMLGAGLMIQPVLINALLSKESVESVMKSNFNNPSYVRTEMYNGTSCHVVTYKQASTRKDVWIGADDSLIYKIEFSSPMKSTSRRPGQPKYERMSGSMVYRNVKINAPLEDTLFAFKAPDGAQEKQLPQKPANKKNDAKPAPKPAPKPAAKDNGKSAPPPPPTTPAPRPNQDAAE